MQKKIYRINPFFEERMWGGQRLRDEFGYVTDVDPIGEVYNVVALLGRADCEVVGENCTLAQLYQARPEVFRCDTPELPIRVNLLDPIADLSVQLHPDDAYALAHDHSRGKPEAWVVVDTTSDGYIEFGHNAQTRQEFADLAQTEQYNRLLRYIPAKKDWFIDIPAGTLHAIGKHVMVYNLSRNADLTYRLYDYHRIHPKTGRERDLHVQKVIDNVNIPDNTRDFVWFEPTFEDGCEITRFWDEPGLYTSLRIKVNGTGRYQQERFAFYTIYDGEGTVGGTPVKKGETVLAPHGFGECVIEGRLDMFVAGYRNQG